MEKQKPEHKIIAGNIFATIWKNKREVNGVAVDMYNVTIERRYQDKDEAWKTTNSYTRDDLAKLGLVVAKAYEWLTLKRAGDETAESV